VAILEWGSEAQLGAMVAAAGQAPDVSSAEHLWCGGHRSLPHNAPSNGSFSTVPSLGAQAQ